MHGNLYIINTTLIHTPPLHHVNINKVWNTTRTNRVVERILNDIEWFCEYSSVLCFTDVMHND